MEQPISSAMRTTIQRMVVDDIGVFQLERPLVFRMACLATLTSFLPFLRSGFGGLDDVGGRRLGAILDEFFCNRATVSCSVSSCCCIRCICCSNSAICLSRAAQPGQEISGVGIGMKGRIGSERSVVNQKHCERLRPNKHRENSC